MTSRPSARQKKVPSSVSSDIEEQRYQTPKQSSLLSSKFYRKKTKKTMMIKPKRKTIRRIGRVEVLVVVVVLVLLYYLKGSRDEASISTESIEVKQSSFIDDDEIFAKTPMCDANGICYEDPTKPSPRTIYSAKSKWQYDRWWKLHAMLNESAAEYSLKRKQERQNKNITTTKNLKRPLILLGDSITESWLGTGLGEPKQRAEGVPDILQQAFVNGGIKQHNNQQQQQQQQQFDPLVLAIGGDQTQHLLYRLQNGELRSTIATDERAIFVMLIGTNNIGSGHLPNGTASGILSIVEFLLTHTQGHLILFELLARGDKFRLRNICPPRCRHEKGVDGELLPFKSFMPAIDKVNTILREKIPKLKMKYGQHRMGLLNCNSNFLLQSSTTTANIDDGTVSEVNVTLMPDELHPNVMGHKILAHCILDYIETYVLS